MFSKHLPFIKATKNVIFLMISECPEQANVQKHFTHT